MTIKVLFILYSLSDPESESESESELESTRSPESESESETEQPLYDSAPLDAGLGSGLAFRKVCLSNRYVPPSLHPATNQHTATCIEHIAPRFGL